MKSFALALILAIVCVFTPLAAVAAPPQKIFRIGALNGSTPEQTVHMFRRIPRGLREHGFVEGENVVIEYRWAEGKLERLPGFATELVNLNVDVIFAPPTPSAVAAHKATKTIPIVFALAADPVGNGLVESLARPGGNVNRSVHRERRAGREATGTAQRGVPEDLACGRAAQPDRHLQSASVEGIAGGGQGRWGSRLVPIGVQRREDLEPLSPPWLRERTGAIIVMENPVNFTIRQQLVKPGATGPVTGDLRVAGVCGRWRAHGLRRKHPNQFRRAGGYVAKILKGRQTGRPAGGAADARRLRGQSQGGQDRGARHSPVSLVTRRRGDPMRKPAYALFLAAVTLAGRPLAPGARRRQNPAHRLSGVSGGRMPQQAVSRRAAGARLHRRGKTSRSTAAIRTAGSRSSMQRPPNWCRRNRT